ncbi:hypothetical protein THAOC_18860 [Thalassiosira oceanica]|uniref:Uncharacterized protein n=1 Tax=Thalassiosira oceanica TaxID=159749 RepID=K0S685_THAOC|nr:hypothetical protein THAOC_18860 [Thalassiosira oceanica]|eukprot:EJK60735.1 hypothetical protein THAOC_18860 [Thalassiosira oceanica]
MMRFFARSRIEMRQSARARSLSNLDFHGKLNQDNGIFELVKRHLPKYLVQTLGSLMVCIFNIHALWKTDTSTVPLIRMSAQNGAVMNPSFNGQPTFLGQPCRALR